MAGLCEGLTGDLNLRLARLLMVKEEPRERPSPPRVGTSTAGDTSAREDIRGDSWASEGQAVCQQRRGSARRLGRDHGYLLCVIGGLPEKE